MSQTCPILIKVCLCAGILLSSCTRKEIIDLSGQPEIPLTGSRIVISGIKGVPEGTEIAYVKASIQGAGSKVIGEVRAEFVGGRAVIDLPEDIASNKLCKVGKDAFDDMVGHWPAKEISDHDAKVAWLDTFFLYNSNDRRIGYIILTDWDRTGAASGKYFVYYHYADRPFTLSGYNISYSGTPSFYYSAASFSPGWNAYANIKAEEDTSKVDVCTTVIPQGVKLFWRFVSGKG